MTKTEKIKLTLRSHFAELAEKYHISELGLFGSINREDFNDQSDVDILVEFSQPVGMEFIELAHELEKLLNRKVDLVSRKAIKPNYFKSIEKDLTYV